MNKSGGAHSLKDELIQLKQENRELVKEISTLQEQLQTKFEFAENQKHLSESRFSSASKQNSRYGEKNYQPEVMRQDYLDNSKQQI